MSAEEELEALDAVEQFLDFLEDGCASCVEAGRHLWSGCPGGSFIPAEPGGSFLTVETGEETE